MVKVHDGREDIFEPRPEDLRDKGEETGTSTLRKKR